MPDLVIVHRGAYYDSVALMLVSRAAAAEPGVRDAAVAMATPLNLELLAARGFDLGAAGELSVNDLVIAIRTEDDAGAERVLAVVERELSADGAPGGPERERAPYSAPVSLLAASRRRPELSVAVLSVPGRHAACEAAAALEAGLHVFCFSNGVGLEAEAVLKHRAGERGLLFMGPDCGTAILDGVGFGFANAVGRGPVGIVGASGTGIQEVCCLLDLAGVGISHAIGVGGRDLDEVIAGAMFRRGLELLAADPGTEVIVGISKRPHPAVASAILDQAATAGKPVVLAFLGLEEWPAPPAGVMWAESLEAAAARAAELIGRVLPSFEDGGSRPGAPGAAPGSRPGAPGAAPGWRRGAPGAIRGLYSGGTLCTEAMTIVSAAAGPVMSNIPLRPEWRVAELDGRDGHAFFDFGADELTVGRPHPMIDPTLRLQRFALEARDPAVTVILLDVVLGYGAHPDPAAEFVPAITRACAERDDLTVIVSLCGTAKDPQGLERQGLGLGDAGALATRGAASAARLALRAAAVGEVPDVRA
jgi:FdrA protein